MAQNKADFTVTFRRLCEAAAARRATPASAISSLIRLPTMPGRRDGAVGWLTTGLRPHTSAYR